MRFSTLSILTALLCLLTCSSAIQHFVYIDPTHTSGSLAGSIENPYATLAQAFTDVNRGLSEQKYKESDEVYLLCKEGTTLNIVAPENNVLIGNKETKLEIWITTYNGENKHFPDAKEATFTFAPQVSIPVVWSLGKVKLSIEGIAFNFDNLETDVKDSKELLRLEGETAEFLLTSCSFKVAQTFSDAIAEKDIAIIRLKAVKGVIIMRNVFSEFQISRPLFAFENLTGAVKFESNQINKISSTKKPFILINNANSFTFTNNNVPDFSGLIISTEECKTAKFAENAWTNLKGDYPISLKSIDNIFFEDDKFLTQVSESSVKGLLKADDFNFFWSKNLSIEGYQSTVPPVVLESKDASTGATISILQGNFTRNKLVYDNTTQGLSLIKINTLKSTIKLDESLFQENEISLQERTSTDPNAPKIETEVLGSSTVWVSSEGAEFKMTDCTFDQNKAHRNLKNLYVNASKINVVTSTFTKNKLIDGQESKDTGSEPFLNFDFVGEVLTFNNNTFKENYGTLGGALQFLSVKDKRTPKEINIKDSIFESNSAKFAGAIYTNTTSESVRLNIDNPTYIGNKAEKSADFYQDTSAPINPDSTPQTGTETQQPNTGESGTGNQPTDTTQPEQNGTGTTGEPTTETGTETNTNQPNNTQQNGTDTTGEPTTGNETPNPTESGTGNQPTDTTQPEKNGTNTAGTETPNPTESGTGNQPTDIKQPEQPDTGITDEPGTGTGTEPTPEDETDNPEPNGTGTTGEPTTGTDNQPTDTTQPEQNGTGITDEPGTGTGTEPTPEDETDNPEPNGTDTTDELSAGTGPETDTGNKPDETGEPTNTGTKPDLTEIPEPGADELEKVTYCAEGFYKLLGPEQKACYPCPEGAECPGNNVIQAKKHYWKDSILAGSSPNEAVNVYYCFKNPDSCLGDGEGKKCAEGYAGVLCGTCAKGTVEKPRYANFLRDECSECSLFSFSGLIPKILLILVPMAILGFTLMVIVDPRNVLEMGKGPSAKRLKLCVLVGLVLSYFQNLYILMTFNTDLSSSLLYVFQPIADPSYAMLGMFDCYFGYMNSEDVVIGYLSATLLRLIIVLSVLKFFFNSNPLKTNTTMTFVTIFFVEGVGFVDLMLSLLDYREINGRMYSRFNMLPIDTETSSFRLFAFPLVLASAIVVPFLITMALAKSQMKDEEIQSRAKLTFLKSGEEFVSQKREHLTWTSLHINGFGRLLILTLSYWLKSSETDNPVFFGSILIAGYYAWLASANKDRNIVFLHGWRSKLFMYEYVLILGIFLVNQVFVWREPGAFGKLIEFILIVGNLAYAGFLIMLIVNEIYYKMGIMDKILGVGQRAESQKQEKKGKQKPVEETIEGGDDNDDINLEMQMQAEMRGLADDMDDDIEKF